MILNQLGNPDLAWQETVNYNVGTDVTVWGNRVNVTFDYYVKITDPLLAIITTPGSMGITSVTMNAGQQKTNGVELTLKVSPVYRPHDRINWNISLNGTHAKAKYAKIGNAFSSLNNEGRASLSGMTRYYDGGSPTAIWGIRWARRFSTPRCSRRSRTSARPTCSTTRTSGRSTTAGRRTTPRPISKASR